MYELRKQNKKTEKIEIVNKGLFKSELSGLVKKAKELQKDQPEFFFWVFNNLKPTKETKK